MPRLIVVDPQFDPTNDLKCKNLQTLIAKGLASGHAVRVIVPSGEPTKSLLGTVLEPLLAPITEDEETKRVAAGGALVRIGFHSSDRVIFQNISTSELSSIASWINGHANYVIPLSLIGLSEDNQPNGQAISAFANQLPRFDSHIKPEDSSTGKIEAANSTAVYSRRFNGTAYHRILIICPNRAVQDELVVKSIPASTNWQAALDALLATTPSAETTAFTTHQAVTSRLQWEADAQRIIIWSPSSEFINQTVNVLGSLPWAGEIWVGTIGAERTASSSVARVEVIDPKFAENNISAVFDLGDIHVIDEQVATRELVSQIMANGRAVLCKSDDSLSGLLDEAQEFSSNVGESELPLLLFNQNYCQVIGVRNHRRVMESLSA